MSYAATLKIIPNPVSKMFGLVRRQDVMRAIKEAREEARLERIANHDKDLAEFAVFVKKLAKEASRPKPTSVSATKADPLVPRS